MLIKLFTGFVDSEMWSNQLGPVQSSVVFPDLTLMDFLYHKSIDI